MSDAVAPTGDPNDRLQEGELGQSGHSNLENHHLALKLALDFLGAGAALCAPGPGAL